MTNCFTFNPFLGFYDGIEMALNVPRPDNSGRVFPPHVRVSSEFIQIDSVKKPVWNDGRLLSAAIRRIDTDRTSFKVFSRNDGDSILVLVDLVTPEGVKRKIDPDVVNAWVAFESDTTEVVLKHPVSGRCLVELDNGDDLTVFDKDGAVYRIVNRDGQMESIRLTTAEMARERILLMQRQLDENESGLGKQHAILGGAARLLEHTRDVDARDVLTDFLCDYSGPDDLPNGLRINICNLLVNYGDLRSVMFSPSMDFGGNVVPLAKSRGKTEAAAKAKKRERSERDREAWLNKQNTKSRA